MSDETALRAKIRALLDDLRPVTPPLDERAAAAKAGAQRIAAPLPEVVMPHEGLKEDARRKAMIDALSVGEMPRGR